MNSIQCTGNKPLESGSSPRQPKPPKLKFHGSIGQIKRLTWDAGVRGHWTAQPNGVWLFRLRNGVGMHWSSTRGTVWFDGPEVAQGELKRVIEAALHRWIYPGTSMSKSAVGRSRRAGVPRPSRRERQ